MMLQLTKRRHILCMGAQESFTLNVQTQLPFNIGIILPSLYICAIHKLPVKSESEAKKLAPAVLDVLLDKTKQYGFEAYKTADNLFCLIAWDKQEVNAKIKDTKAIKWFFAQDVFMHGQNVNLTHNKALIWLDGVALELPRAMLSSPLSSDIKIQTNLLHGFWKISKPSTSKTPKIADISLVVLSFAFMLQIIYYLTAFLDARSMEQNIWSNIGLADKSEFASNLKELRDIENKQVAMRRNLSVLEELSSFCKVESFRLSKNSLEIVLKTNNTQKLKTVLAKYILEALVISGDTANIRLGIK